MNATQTTTTTDESKVLADAAAAVAEKVSKASTARDEKARITAAKNLDEKLRATSRRVNDQLQSWFGLVVEARELKVHMLVSPSFETWQAYITDVLSKDAPLLHAVARQPIASMLRDQGLSLPAIAKILGVSVGTVFNDTTDKKQGVAQSHNTVDAQVKKLEQVAKAVTRDAAKIDSKGQARLQKEMSAAMDAVATVAQQAIAALEKVRANTGKSDQISTKELERLQVALQSTTAAVDQAVLARSAGRPGRRQTRRAA